MQLNLPILHLLENSENILIAGAGGGFDIFAGLPIYFTLKEMGKNVHLANYSFMHFKLAKVLGDPIIEIDGVLIGARGQVKHDFAYYPEGFLAEWFTEQDDDTIVWMIQGSAVPLVQKAYERLIRKLNIDAIILVDGGVDSLMRGDESNPGSLLEDTISLVAIEAFDVPVKILASVGFGTEQEEDVCHYTALENMAMLIKEGSFYGSCALTPQMEAFQKYEQACRHAWEQPGRKKSHISTRIIPAVQGEFGNYHMYPDDDYKHSRLFVSPLMGLYWFFDADGVVKQSLLADVIRHELTKQDAFTVALNFMSKDRTKDRPRRQIPY